MATPAVNDFLVATDGNIVVREMSGCRAKLLEPGMGVATSILERQAERRQLVDQALEELAEADEQHGSSG